VRHFLILFLFIIHAPPLKYFYRRPFHSPPGDNMTTMVEANKYRLGCFFVAAVLAGICGGVMVSEMLAVGHDVVAISGSLDALAV